MFLFAIRSVRGSVPTRHIAPGARMRSPGADCTSRAWLPVAMEATRLGNTAIDRSWAVYAGLLYPSVALNIMYNILAPLVSEQE